jgi:hypothetical protein
VSEEERKYRPNPLFVDEFSKVTKGWASLFDQTDIMMESTF